jgi:hypothetical protein
MSKRRLSRLDVKHAILTDKRFRELFPELQEDIAKVLHNPSCACNIPIYDQFFKYKDRLAKYFTDKEIKSPQEEAEEENINHWNVVNCKADELEEVLNGLHKIGRIQLAIARYQDEITLVTNSAGYIF